MTSFGLFVLTVVTVAMSVGGCGNRGMDAEEFNTRSDYCRSYNMTSVATQRVIYRRYEATQTNDVSRVDCRDSDENVFPSKVK